MTKEEISNRKLEKFNLSDHRKFNTKDGYSYREDYVKEFIKNFTTTLRAKRRWTREELTEWIKKLAGKELSE